MINRWTILAVLFLARTTMGFQFQGAAALSPFLMERYGVTLLEVGEEKEEGKKKSRENVQNGMREKEMKKRREEEGEERRKGRKAYKEYEQNQSKKKKTLNE